jgi:hypothetical protein
VITGVLFFAAFFGIASGSKGSGVSVAFAVAVVLGWAWISAVATHPDGKAPIDLRLTFLGRKNALGPRKNASRK